MTESRQRQWRVSSVLYRPVGKRNSSMPVSLLLDCPLLKMAPLLSQYNIMPEVAIDAPRSRAGCARAPAKPGDVPDGYSPFGQDFRRRTREKNSALPLLPICQFSNFREQASNRMSMFHRAWILAQHHTPKKRAFSSSSVSFFFFLDLVLFFQSVARSAALPTFHLSHDDFENGSRPWVFLFFSSSLPLRLLINTSLVGTGGTGASPCETANLSYPWSGLFPPVCFPVPPAFAHQSPTPP